MLNCQSGVWKSQDSGQYTDVAMWETTSTKGVTYQVPGVHKYCFISGLMSAGDNGTCRVYQSGSSWWLDLVGYNGSSTQRCWVSCID